MVFVPTAAFQVTLGLFPLVPQATRPPTGAFVGFGCIGIGT
jgi:hypothetical protein